jgi:replicative DNA helicase Mcm
MVEKEDVSRARQLVGESMRQVGLDPETAKYDADVIETGTSQSQHERIQTLTAIVTDLSDEGSAGAPFNLVVEEATTIGMSDSAARETIQKLRNQGQVYSPATSEHGDELRVTK